MIYQSAAVNAVGFCSSLQVLSVQNVWMEDRPLQFWQRILCKFLFYLLIEFYLVCAMVYSLLCVVFADRWICGCGGGLKDTRYH